MKKLFLTALTVVCSLGANAQHVEWSASNLPTLEEATTAGYNDYWGVGYKLPDNYTLCEGDGFKAVIEKGGLVSAANQVKNTPLALYMGSQAGRSGIDPIVFIDGLDASGMYRTFSYNNEGVSWEGTQNIITLTVDAAAEGAPDGTGFGRVSLNYSRGGNLSGMYVVDATANNGEGMVVLGNLTRCTSDAKKVHTATFGVQPGHTYYVLASDNNSVELYGLSFDVCSTSEAYEQIISDDNCPVNWSAANLPTLEEAITAGYNDYWGVGYKLPDNYTLCEGDGFKAMIEKGGLVSAANQVKNTPLALYMGSQAGRSGIDPIVFIDGLDASGMYRTFSYNNEGVSWEGTQNIITLTVDAAAEGSADGTGFGRVSLNYSRGGNLSGMYVVDATANNGEGMVVLGNATRCTSDAKKVHTATFGVQPGHTYYVLSSDNNSVELYGIGFCLNTNDKYEAFGTGSTSGIKNIVTTTTAPTDNKIYSIDGRFVGTQKEGLASGLYIQNGKKFIKK